VVILENLGNKEASDSFRKMTLPTCTGENDIPALHGRHFGHHVRDIRQLELDHRRLRNVSGQVLGVERVLGEDQTPVQVSSVSCESNAMIIQVQDKHVLNNAYHSVPHLLCSTTSVPRLKASTTTASHLQVWSMALDGAK